VGKIGRPSPGLMARFGVPVGERVKNLRAVSDLFSRLLGESRSKLGSLVVG
jgi:hypothetical protein